MPVQPAPEQNDAFGRLPVARSVGLLGKATLPKLVQPENPNYLRSLIARYATANGVPFALADAVVRMESGYDPNLRSGHHMGLMQIHPATAKELGYYGNIDGLLDSDMNLKYGMRYLAMAYRRANGDVCSAVMYYQGDDRLAMGAPARRSYCNKVKMLMAENRN